MSFADSGSPRPRSPTHGPTRSTRGLLTTGLVGGWLAGAAWAVFLAFMTMAVVAGVRDRVEVMSDFFVGASMILLLAGFVWVGGMVCAVVGWFGLAALHPVARTIAWAGIVVLASIIVMPLFASGLRESGVRAVGSLTGLFFVLFYLGQGLFWIGHGKARGAARLALVGSFGVALCGLVLMALMWADARGLEGVLITLAFVGPACSVLAHVGSGLAIAAERETVRALQSFD